MSEQLEAFKTAKSNLLSDYKSKLADLDSLKSELLSVGFTEDDLVKVYWFSVNVTFAMSS